MLQVLDNVCTNQLGNGIPSQIAYIIHLVYVIIRIGVPLLLIIMGMLDLGKAVMAQKEDEIKKGQQLFIKRLIAAALVFFVLVFVRIVVNLLADDGAGQDASTTSRNIMTCIDEILGCDSFSSCGGNN